MSPPHITRITADVSAEQKRRPGNPWSAAELCWSVVRLPKLKLLLPPPKSSTAQAATSTFPRVPGDEKS